MKRPGFRIGRASLQVLRVALLLLVLLLLSRLGGALVHLMQAPEPGNVVAISAQLLPALLLLGLLCAAAASALVWVHRRLRLRR